MTASELVTAAIDIDATRREVVIGGDEPQSAGSGSGSGVTTNLITQTPSTNKAGVAKTTILADAPIGASATVRIQTEPVHQGTITKSEPGTGARRRITSFDAVHTLKQTFIDVTFDEVTAGEAITEIANTVGIDVELRALPFKFTPRISRSFKQKPADEIIDTLTKLTDTISVVSPTNVLIIGSPEKIGVQRDLTRIIDASAGNRRPQYESVQVIGNTATAERGRGARHLISSQPVIAEAGDGQPTFIFEDDGITSQEQANNTSENLLRRLKKQQQGGFATIVGRPEIRPFDIVTFPPAQGGSEFRVANVEHKITQTDGFQTRLSLSGDIV